MNEPPVDATLYVFGPGIERPLRGSLADMFVGAPPGRYICVEVSGEVGRANSAKLGPLSNACVLRRDDDVTVHVFKDGPDLTLRPGERLRLSEGVVAFCVEVGTF